MNQQEFKYALYHDQDDNIRDTLANIEAIETFSVVVSITNTACRDKQPISDKRTTVKIKINDQYSFQQLDNRIEEKFTEVWFEH